MATANVKMLSDWLKLLLCFVFASRFLMLRVKPFVVCECVPPLFRRVPLSLSLFIIQRKRKETKVDNIGRLMLWRTKASVYVNIIQEHWPKSVVSVILLRIRALKRRFKEPKEPRWEQMNTLCLLPAPTPQSPACLTIVCRPLKCICNI